MKPKKQYVVTCKSMNPHGELLFKGATFWMDEGRAQDMRTYTPHLTFEEVEKNEAGGKVVRTRRKSRKSTDA